MQIYSMMDNLPDNDGYIGWCGGFELDSEATLTLDVEATDDTEYMFSAWLKCNQYGIVSPNELDVSKGDYVNSNAWKRVSFATKVSNKEINIIFSKGKWEIYKAQLERGNKLTDWKENSEEASVENVYKQGTTQIDGDKIYTGSITADKIDVTDLFAQNITATGTITGMKIVTTRGNIGSWDINNDGFYENSTDEQHRYIGWRITPAGGLLHIKSTTDDSVEVDASYDNDGASVGSWNKGSYMYWNEIHTAYLDSGKSAEWTGNLVKIKARDTEHSNLATLVMTKYQTGAEKQKVELSTDNIKISDEANSCTITPSTLNVTNATTSSIAIANGTNKALASVTLSKGKYLIIGSISYASNSTGRRLAGMSTSSTSFLGAVSRNAIANAVNGDRTNIQVQTVVNVTSASETWYLLGYQNSGGELSGNMANIEAIRLQ